MPSIPARRFQDPMQQIREVGCTQGWCFFCKRSKHADCELHVNDDAHDALDFVNVNCECPCQGEVPRPSGKLIDLVKVLREHTEQLVAEIDEKEAEIKKLQSREAEAIVMLRDFFEEYVDDEGDLLGLSRNRSWHKGVEDLRDKFQKLVDKITETTLIDVESEEDLPGLSEMDRPFET